MLTERLFSGGKFGKLGHGDEAPKALPTRVMGELAELRVVQVSAGKAHTAALTDGGTVYTWGEGTDGQFNKLGHGATELEGVHGQSLFLTVTLLLSLLRSLSRSL